MGTSILIEYAVFVLWSLICFSIGRMFGRPEKIESEPITVKCKDQTAPHYEEKEQPRRRDPGRIKKLLAMDKAKDQYERDD